MSETSDLLVASGSHVGLVHHTNEDNYTVFPMPPNCQLLAVCDGMGGMGRGDEASAIAVEVIEEHLSEGAGFAPDRMEDAIRKADIAIRQRLAVPGNTPGSTAVLIAVDQGLAHVVWAGDSRGYWFRGGTMIERTRDHKLVNELVDAGELTPEEAKLSALAHVVTKALGGRGPGEPAIQADRIDHPWKLHSGDTLLLCSDGLCDLASDEEIAQLACQEDLDQAVEELTQLALDRGGHDNITIVIGRWVGNDFDDEALETPVITSPRTLTPTPAPSSAGRDVTWDDIDPTAVNPPEDSDGTDASETADPDPVPQGQTQSPEPAPREPAADEEPKVGMAIAVAVVAIVLILIAVMTASGFFG